MDCVGCDKCKLWGKVQVQGVGTALKVLFSGRKNGRPLYLSRMEIISLFNVLGRWVCVGVYLLLSKQAELFLDIIIPYGLKDGYLLVNVHCS